MRGKFLFANTLVIVAIIAVLYFRNWQTIVLFLAVLVFLMSRYSRARQKQ
jgi:preprotein translocase subunit YajC